MSDSVGVERVAAAKARMSVSRERVDDTAVAVEHAIAEMERVVAAARAAVERAKAEHEAAVAEKELDDAVNMPVSDGRDPTMTLPDEVLLIIFLVVPFETLFSGTCALVCRRWARVMKSSGAVTRRKWE